MTEELRIVSKREGKFLVQLTCGCFHPVSRLPALDEVLMCSIYHGGNYRERVYGFFSMIYWPNISWKLSK